MLFNDLVQDCSQPALLTYWSHLNWWGFVLPDGQRLCLVEVAWGPIDLTHCGLVMPYGDRDLGQHWLRSWLVAWRHQAITWTNVDWSSVKSSDIDIMAISQEMPQAPITKICLKIACLKFHSNFPGANELKFMKLPLQNLWQLSIFIVQKWNVNVQLNCCDMCKKIGTRSDHYFSCKSNIYFHKI